MASTTFTINVGTSKSTVLQIQKYLGSITQSIGRANRAFVPTTVSPIGYIATPQEKASLDTLNNLIDGVLWGVSLGVNENEGAFSHMTSSKHSTMQIMNALKKKGIRSKYERMYGGKNFIIYTSVYRVMKAVNPNLITGYELGIT